MLKQLSLIQRINPGLPTFLENEIPQDSGSFQEKFAEFSWRNKNASNDILSHQWATEQNLDFKHFKTVYPAENKGLEIHFFAIFILGLQSKLLKKCSSYYSLCYGI